MIRFRVARGAVCQTERRASPARGPGRSADHRRRARLPGHRRDRRPAGIQARAQRFAILADPTRLTILTCIQAAGPISVSDLAAATGINDATVSQTLRYLRAAQTVSTERDGRVIRYQLADSAVGELLAHP